MAGSKQEVKIFAAIAIAVAIFFAWLIFKPEKEEKEPVTVIKMVDLSEFRNLPMVSIANLQFVELKLNGVDGLFLIDTGAEESVFNLDLSDSLKISMLDSIPLPNSRIYVTDTLKVVAADTLFKFDKKFYAYSLNNFSSKVTQIDSVFKMHLYFGILGQDLMRQEGMILNFQNNKIYLTNKYNQIK